MVPRVQTSGGVAGSSGKTVVPLFLDGKKSAPPVPPTRHKGGVPIVTLPASSTIHKDKDAPMRRPAPLPPNRRGAVGESRTETDDDDDVDNNDDKDDSNNNNDGERATGTPALASAGTFQSAKDAKRDTDGKLDKAQDESDQEVLLKPSQLKKQQKAPGALSGSKAGDVTFIKPGLPMVANKPRVALPGSGISVALVGLNTVGHGAKGTAQSGSMSEGVNVEDTDKPTPSLSVTDLKKSFTAGTAAPTSKGVASSPRRTTIATVGGSSSGHAVAPVIPMVKPLSFNTAGSGLGPNLSRGRATTVAGPVQHGSGFDRDRVMAGSGAETEAEAKDVKPASGSVKQAIAALKASAGNEAGTSKSTTAKEEDEEEEKIDAFAFWKKQ